VLDAVELHRPASECWRAQAVARGVELGPHAKEGHEVNLPSIDELLAGGKENYLPFLRVRAKLNASGDSLSTPTFVGWSMEFHCEPIE
jgi:hypothetical protein